MASHDIHAIPLTNLMVDLVNPRHVPQPSQREAIAAIAHDQGPKLANLAADIADRGLNPGELLLVAPAHEEGMFMVLEGNRRIAALKLMTSPSLLTSIGLPKNLTERFKELHRSSLDSLPTEVNCSVISREEAHHWINQKHTGENDGVGIVMWDGRARQRFRGMSPALQAIEMVEESDLIDEDTKNKLAKISITNVERVLSTPEARKALGVDIQKGELVFVAPQEEALGRLAMLVGDVANKKVKVTDLDSKDQRVAYAEEVADRPLPSSIAGNGTSNGSGNGTSAGRGIPAAKPSSGRKVRPDRKFLIPRTCKLTIDQPRLNKIYHELQRLDVERYTNSCAVMFRVFIELSLDHYGQGKRIVFKVSTPPKPPSTTPGSRDMYLREKIKAVYEYMEGASIADKNELRGIKSLYANKDHVLSVDGMNAYVHNKEYNPTPTDLKANWDSIQMFVEKLWTA